MEIYFDWELDEKLEQPIHKWVYDDGSIETRYYFIPQDLGLKMNEALTQDDMDYIMEMVGQKIDKKGNEN